MITDVNPFIYSHPLAPEDIIDREEETQELLRNVVGGHFVHRHGLKPFFSQQTVYRLDDGVFARQQHLCLEGSLGGEGARHGLILAGLV